MASSPPNRRRDDDHRLISEHGQRGRRKWRNRLTLCFELVLAFRDEMTMARAAGDDEGSVWTVSPSTGAKRFAREVSAFDRAEFHASAKRSACFCMRTISSLAVMPSGKAG